MSFLEELQSLEGPTKTKILVISTILIMVVVLYCWLAYFNGIVSDAGDASVADQDSGTAAPVAAATTSPQPSFWSKVGNGSAIVGQAIGGGEQWIVGLFEQPKEYIIK